MLHHLTPLTTTSSPSIFAVACMLVASLDATGSVMQKAERIFTGQQRLEEAAASSDRRFEVEEDLHVAGIGRENVKISGARNECPIRSASRACSTLLSPAPYSSSGRRGSKGLQARLLFECVEFGSRRPPKMRRVEVERLLADLFLGSFDVLAHEFVDTPEVVLCSLGMLEVHLLS